MINDADGLVLALQQYKSEKERRDFTEKQRDEATRIMAEIRTRPSQPRSRARRTTWPGLTEQQVVMV